MYLKVHGCRTEAVKCIRINVVLGLPTQNGEIFVVVFCISVFNYEAFSTFLQKDYCEGRLRFKITNEEGKPTKTCSGTIHAVWENNVNIFPWQYLQH